MHLGIPSKKRKRAVSTVTSDQVDADTPAATQMDPEVKFADQVPSPVASCKLHILANLESVAYPVFDQVLQLIPDRLHNTVLHFYLILNWLPFIVVVFEIG